MTKLLINGNFLCRNLTGIERFAWEICARFDALLASSDDVSIFVPVNAKRVPEYAHIKIIKSDTALKSFPLWDTVVFAKACRTHGAIALDFSNTAPLGKTCGVAFIHDIYAKDFPNDFTSFRDKLVAAYCRFHYRNICKNARLVCTVSHFSKERIASVYGVPESRIAVIENGWEHFNEVQSDAGVFVRFPKLKNNNYYFTLGSLSKRKNLAWIASHAARYANELFAVSGKAISALVPRELESLKKLSNVVLLGYVSDGEVKALMEACKAFIFPSYYEGFGIPPLEALSCGTRVICANSASLPEIYRNCVHYIDPKNSAVDLPSLLAQPVTAPDEILAAYTYENAAKKLYAALNSL
ncbi:glycosyltransferase family 1 protein [Treponema sp. Marseille-Q4130]|uniref:glycosyltransferase family 4 protein n=1 Tax=Treponema sp. Marseille-Q4130 TaxID=2766702 RepID=UPI001651E5C4|nr:glycosyltransferase family 1 protein [Treponema sp. Marseille-Q4130]MBC6719980.1 glycosyltransferase family 4 protein [Treponema sp. Marseille-Q4130]